TLRKHAGNCQETALRRAIAPLLRTGRARVRHGDAWGAAGRFRQGTTRLTRPHGAGERPPMRYLLRVLLALGSLGSSPLLASVTPGDSAAHLAVDGRERQFLLHVPPGYTGAHPVPLVLDLHGWSSNAAQQKGISGMVAVSDAEGFVLAHPDGL